jgi:hypothetical protein
VWSAAAAGSRITSLLLCLGAGLIEQANQFLLHLWCQAYFQCLTHSQPEFSDVVLGIAHNLLNFWVTLGRFAQAPPGVRFMDAAEVGGCFV